MITLQKKNGIVNSGNLELIGLSTDEKPVKYFENFYIPNGSIFLEIDTSDKYIYNEDEKNWIKTKTKGGSVEVDTTLTKSGAAADAKAVGDAISNAIGSIDSLLATMVETYEEVLR